MIAAQTLSIAAGLSILAFIAGILCYVLPSRVTYIVGVYLIIVGILGLFAR